MSKLIALLAAALALLAVGPAAAQITVKKGRHGEQIIVLPPDSPVHTYSISPSPAGPAVVGRVSEFSAQLPKDLPPQFRWDGEVLVHAPTGARLPKAHDGCRLAAIGPITPYKSKVEGYERGGFAEYDCRPATDLTYVTVIFEGGSALLTKEQPGMGVAKVASNMVLHETEQLGKKAPCRLMDLSGVVGHPNRELQSAQCGVKWGKRADPKTLYGSAAVVVGRGANYVMMTNTCIDPLCATNRPKFAHFIDTFDQSALKPDLG